MNGTGRRITTEEATLKTATVEIRTLTINGKQMTLAVFRQLIEEPVIDKEAAKLQGELWGIVNYHTGVGCDHFKNQPHVHVVWQNGNELRRSSVRYPSPHFFADHFKQGLQDQLDEQGTAWVAAATLNGWKPNHWESLREFSCNYSLPNTEFTVTFGTHRLATILVTRAMLDVWRYGETGQYPDSVARARSELTDEAELDGVLMSPEHWKTWAVKTANVMNDWVEAYMAAYAQLESLDQLFIAV